LAEFQEVKVVVADQTATVWCLTTFLHSRSPQSSSSSVAVFYFVDDSKHVIHVTGMVLYPGSYFVTVWWHDTMCCYIW